MASITADRIGSGAAGGRAKGGFRRVFDRMVTARERQVRRYVNGYLLTLDDATLKTYGYDRARLESEGSQIYPL